VQRPQFPAAQRDLAKVNFDRLDGLARELPWLAQRIGLTDAVA